MRTLLRSLLVATLLTMAAIGVAPGAASADPVNICGNQAVPAGWVVISVRTSAGCGGGTLNQRTIKTPGAIENVCLSSAIPSGYVVVAQQTNSVCGGSPLNQRTIKIPGAVEYVCQSSPIPPGYVVVSSHTSTVCGGSPLNQRRITRVG
ncbi:hypothetical protein OG792_25960 [Micromonospora sp. NBC_01699]|uniref:hypothetical protein n=1 Tax=Micromonospora sp. NBC_01699 TaxID=2975984 RepID=UPI002E2E87C9|nr:hypothetical protein [Micromonospora sp. NBC_01699]